MQFYKKYINQIRKGTSIIDLTTRPLVSGESEKLPVKRHILLDTGMVPETVLYQAMHEVNDLEEKPPDYQIFHSHDFVETYIFLGRDPDYSGLLAEVILESERYEVVSPASVYIPAGISHKYKMLCGSGLLIVTALRSVYTYSSA